MEFMRSAIEEGNAGVECGDGGPFGAVVVRLGQIVGRGHNMVLVSNDPTAHAEVVALRNASKALGTFDLSGCVLYTSCYPCPMCLGAALWARVDNVFYAASPNDVSNLCGSTIARPRLFVLAASVGFDDANFHEFVRDPQADGRTLLAHLPIEGHMAPFEKWARKEDRRMY